MHSLRQEQSKTYIYHRQHWSGQRRPRKRCWRTFWPFIRIPNTYKQNYFKSKLQSRPNQKILFQAQHHKLQTIIHISLIRPILEYCTVIWFPLYKTDSQEIEKVQRRASKLVPTLKDLPYPERLKTLNLTTLAYRRNRTDMTKSTE